MFTFDLSWGSLGATIFGNSSSAANNTLSKLSFRFLRCFLSYRFLSCLKLSDLKTRLFVLRQNRLCFITFKKRNLSASCSKFQYYICKMHSSKRNISVCSKQVTQVVTFVEESQNSNKKLTILRAKTFYFNLRLANYRVSI